MKTAHLSQEALEAATPGQAEAIVRLLRAPSVGSITVQKGGFGLPDGYLSFLYDYAEGFGTGSIFGGIDTEGSVST